MVLAWPVQRPQVSMVTCPLHDGVKSYHTSGEFSEKPQGEGGREPAGEGVAQAVVPHAAGEPTPTAIALAQLSFAGGMPVGPLIFKRNCPLAKPYPPTRM